LGLEDTRAHSSRPLRLTTLALVASWCWRSRAPPRRRRRPLRRRPLPPNLAAKLDGRLLPIGRVAGRADPVWLTFADKGERGVSDLVSRSPRPRRRSRPAHGRRLRAHVTPLVDERDLRWTRAILAELSRRGSRRGRGLALAQPAAVRLAAGRLAELAELPFGRASRPSSA